MKRSNFIHLLIIFCAALMLLGILAPAAMAKKLTVRFAWYMPPNTATDKQGTTVAKEIESLSHGQIQVQTYPSGSLLKASNIAQGLTNNTANMGIFAMHWWSTQEPSLEWDTIPFLIDDAGALLKALHGKLGEDVNKTLNKHGVQIVGWGFYGCAKSHVNTKTPYQAAGGSEGSAHALGGRAFSPVSASRGRDTSSCRLQRSLHLHSAGRPGWRGLRPLFHRF